MEIRYNLRADQTMNLAHMFQIIETSAPCVLDALARVDLHISSYNMLTTPQALAPLAERHYDSLLHCAKLFGTSPVDQEVAMAEQRLQVLVAHGPHDEIQSTVDRLADEAFWEIYARIYEPLMGVGLAQTLFARHFDAVTGTRLLDIGAGTGIITNAELRKGKDVTAIEPQSSMRQRMLAHARTIVSGGMLTIIPTFFVPGMTMEGLYDHVVLRYVMYFFEDYRAVLQTAHAYLRKGGTIAISNPLPKGAHGEEFQAYLERRRRENAALPLGWRSGIYDATQARLARGSHLIDEDVLIATMQEIGFRITTAESYEMRTAMFVVGEK